MNEIASQSAVVSVLRQSLQSDNLPHLLFYGPPGTGKTSTILALARELFGPTLFRTRILELNASDERGISVIREKVKSFAKVTVRETVPGYPCPPFKLIILDEADSLTVDAQTALRRTIEQYSRSTRFCLICNYVSRIIDPLTSRCAKFRFGAVEMEAAVGRLTEIVAQECVRIGDGETSATVLGALVERCEGDLRRAITLLQGIHRLGRPLTVAAVDELAGTVSADLLATAMRLLATPSAAMANTLRAFVTETFGRKAQPPTQFIHQLVPVILQDPTLTATQKALMAGKAAEVDARISDGADEIVQTLDLFATLRAILHPAESATLRTRQLVLMQ